MEDYDKVINEIADENLWEKYKSGELSLAEANKKLDEFLNKIVPECHGDGYCLDCGFDCPMKPEGCV